MTCRGSGVRVPYRPPKRKSRVGGFFFFVSSVLFSVFSLLLLRTPRLFPEKRSERKEKRSGVRKRTIGYACGRRPHPSAALRLPPVSLRLGHAAALTCHRHVIHYRGAASLPKGEGSFLVRCARIEIPPLAGRAIDNRPYGCRPCVVRRRGAY